MSSFELSALCTTGEREALLLAPYAMHSADSRGRKYPEPEHSYRGPYQRDRDRVLHSAAYRRLSGKMQVFTGDMGDYHRTRLTHTQEVASIARTIGRALRLNEDLIEALALLHDIGHPPFGHAGEDALAECLAGEGGFSHNRQAIVIVEELEHRYRRFPGLNLTREVLAGQEARSRKGPDPSREPSGAHPLLEAQVVEAADSITYDAHDTDDAVKLGLVSLAELADVPFASEATRRAQERYGPLEGKLLRNGLVHELIDWQGGDLVRHTAARLEAAEFRTAAAAQAAGFALGVSPEVAGLKAELEEFLYERVYRHPQLAAVRREAQSRLRAMFDGYLKRPELLPEKFRARGAEVGPARSVGDYLAGMTDRFCDEQYRKYFAASSGG
jgi:dGTPase